MLAQAPFFNFFESGAGNRRSVRKRSGQSALVLQQWGDTRSTQAPPHEPEP